MHFNRHNHGKPGAIENGSPYTHTHTHTLSRPTNRRHVHSLQYKRQLKTAFNLGSKYEVVQLKSGLLTKPLIFHVRCYL
jgi:hypothetical protein